MAFLSDARFTLEIESLPPDLLHLGRIEGHEALSDLYRFDLVLASTDHSLALADVIGQRALITIHGAGPPRLIHGIVARFEQGEEGKRLAHYHATIVPSAWLLLHRHDCRIFQQMKVPEIIAKVLDAAGITDYRLVIHGEHPTLEYCVQYRESDWAFILRLMERDGILCFFEHHESKHVLVMSDTLHVHEPIPGGAPIPFRASAGALSAEDHVSRFRVAQEINSGRVALRDFNFLLPNLSLESHATGGADKALEVYDYPGDYVVPGVGQEVAKIRLEQRRTPVRTGAGEAGCPRFTPGYLFSLEEHPQDVLNGSWLLTRVEHRGTEPTLMEAAPGEVTRYSATFQCMPAEIPFRPPSRTPRPTIKGVQTAIVVGPSGEEIYTDPHGRVKVQFHWDREGRNDEHSSCWIRVSQTFAGQGWGSMWIPRIGHEVIVDFLEGDPDRPIITGRVYHEVNKPPYPLPAEKTKSTIKSNSSPGGGGYNELRFEDKKGQEEIFLHGQKDWNIVIEHDKNQLVGHDETHKVGHDRQKEVVHDQSETIGHDKSIRVGQDHAEVIGRNETKMVGVNRVEMVGANLSETVGVNKSVEIGSFKSEVVGLGSSEAVGALKSIAVGGAFTITVGAGMATTVTGSHVETVSNVRAINAGSKFTVDCGAAKIMVDKSGLITIEATDLKIKASGEVQIDADSGVKVTTPGAVKVKGAAVKLN